MDISHNTSNKRKVSIYQEIIDEEDKLLDYREQLFQLLNRNDFIQKMESILLYIHILEDDMKIIENKLYLNECYRILLQNNVSINNSEENIIQEIEENNKIIQDIQLKRDKYLNLLKLYEEYRCINGKILQTQNYIDFLMSIH
jgi:hypothetical protein